MSESRELARQIYDAKERLITTDEQVYHLIKRIERRTSELLIEIKTTVAFDLELKNDSQRKAREAEMVEALIKQSTDLQQMQETLEVLKISRMRQENQHQLFKNLLAIMLSEGKEVE